MKPCIIWPGKPNNSGYGSTYLNGQRIGAHVAAYEKTYGPFDKTLCVCHHCDTPLCVEPTHLFLGTRKENTQDAVRKNRMKKCYRWTKENNPNKGVPMSEEKRKAVSKWKQRPFAVVSPTGEIIHRINLRQFCFDNALNQGGMWSVINGSKPHHKGFTKLITPI